MNSFWENMAAVCTVIVVSELAGRLCGEHGMVNFVRALGILALLSSLLLSLFSLDPELDFSSSLDRAEQARGELSSYVEEQEGQAAGIELERYLQGLLGAAGIEAKKIEAVTDIGEDGRIVLKKVRAVFRYESDMERAGVLLRNTLGEETEVEVQADGS